MTFRKTLCVGLMGWDCWVASAATQRRQTALLEAPLVPSHTSHRATEGARNLFLFRPALIDKADHRMRFGHAVAPCVLGDHDPRNDHNAMSVVRHQETARIDDRCAIRRADFREEIPLPRYLTHGGTIAGRPKKRTVLGSSPRRGRYGLSGDVRSTV